MILNPGENVQDTGYFSIADQIVTAEDFYSDFRFVTTMRTGNSLKN